jgi:hypothetical protein
LCWKRQRKREWEKEAQTDPHPGRTKEGAPELSNSSSTPEEAKSKLVHFKRQQHFGDSLVPRTTEDKIENHSY